MFNQQLKYIMIGTLLSGCTNQCDPDETVSNTTDATVNTAENAVDNTSNANVGPGDEALNEQRGVTLDAASSSYFSNATVTSERNIEIGKNAWMIKMGDSAKNLEIKIKGDVQEGKVYSLVDEAAFNAAPGADAGATSGVDSEAVVATAKLSDQASGSANGTIQFSDVPAVDSFDYKMTFDISAGGQALKGAVVDTLVGEPTDSTSAR